MRLLDIEQGSEAWFNIRLGKITASHFQDVQAGGQGKTRAKYMKQLRAERIYGVRAGSDYSNKHMDRGTELEPEALDFYENSTFSVVDRVGFVEVNEWMGISPDGLIADDGGLELKCPMLLTHLEYLEKGTLPSAYKWQVHGSMMATGRKWWDFVSYHPDAFTDSRDDRLFILRVERNEKLCDSLRYDCNLFIEELKAKIELITGKA
jgi:putative phage-type endonuclease